MARDMTYIDSSHDAVLLAQNPLGLERGLLLDIRELLIDGFAAESTERWSSERFSL